MFEVESCIRGFHVYGAVWKPRIGEIFSCSRKGGNREDPFAVAVQKSSPVLKCRIVVATPFLAAYLAIFAFFIGVIFSYEPLFLSIDPLCSFAELLISFLTASAVEDETAFSKSGMSRFLGTSQERIDIATNRCRPTLRSYDRVIMP